MRYLIDYYTFRTPSDSLSGNKVSIKQDVPDPRDLDILLGELTLMNARAELYLRFIRRRVTVSINTKHFIKIFSPFIFYQLSLQIL